MRVGFRDDLPGGSSGGQSCRRQSPWPSGAGVGTACRLMRCLRCPGLGPCAGSAPSGRWLNGRRPAGPPAVPVRSACSRCARGPARRGGVGVVRDRHPRPGRRRRPDHGLDRGRSWWSRARRRQRDWSSARSSDLEVPHAARDRPLVRRRTGVRLPRARGRLTGRVRARPDVDGPADLAAHTGGRSYTTSGIPPRAWHSRRASPSRLSPSSSATARWPSPLTPTPASYRPSLTPPRRPSPTPFRDDQQRRQTAMRTATGRRVTSQFPQQP